MLFFYFVLKFDVWLYDNDPVLGVWIYGYFAIRLTVTQYGRLNG